MKIHIKNSEHVFIAGSTGSGKTMLAKAYGSKIKKVFVLDTKGTFFFEPFLLEDDYVIVDELQKVMKISNYGKIKKIVYRPKLTELKLSYYNDFFKYCYMVGDNTVIVDEAMQVIKNPYNIPEFYAGILQRGRELNVNVWSLTQRPSGVSQLIMTEATHYFIFRLTHINDRKKISDITGMEDFIKNPNGYNFRYWKNGSFNSEIGVIKFKQKLLKED